MLPLDPDIKDALLGKDNRYRQVLDVVLDYEQGDGGIFPRVPNV